LRVWVDRVRLRHWAHFLLLPLATFDPAPGLAEAGLAAARGIVIAFAILAFGYLINQVSDRGMDLDPRKNPFVADDSQQWLSLAVLLAVALLLATQSPWPAQLATLSCLVFGYVYSMGPRIKSTPILGSLANFGNLGPLLFVGMATPALPPRFGALVLAFAAILLQNQLIHEAGDAVEDRGGGVRTTWLSFGPTWTSAMAAGLGVVATLATARLVHPGAAAALASLSAALFGASFPLLLARRGSDWRKATRLRIAHRWCAATFGALLFAAWRWPA
jgi:4-hydroxybenzoate polyprenyltransferase